MHVIHGQEIHGDVVDNETRCSHYNSSLDIIAIIFKCCGRWFPCRECHDETESHEPEVWPQAEFDTSAILCGACGHQLSINEYLKCEYTCPKCGAEFNPRCANHNHLYFKMDV